MYRRRAQPHWLPCVPYDLPVTRTGMRERLRGVTS
jgi:hypothetical protein